MLTKFFTSLGRIYTFLVSVILAVVLGIISWMCWVFYGEVKLRNEFAAEGKLVSANVVEADHSQRSWRDMLGNIAYLTVRYQGNDYPVRFVIDSVYVGQGDQVKLLYHPRYDALLQPENHAHVKQSSTKSRLIDWSTVTTFTDENKLLLLCLVLSAASFFFISGVIVSVVALPFLQDIARLLLVVGLVIATLFFTYDTWEYFDYYQTLKNKGYPVSVTVLSTDRISRRSTSSGKGWRSYDYQATIRYQQQERIIPISEDDFEVLKPNDSLQALYDESLNDCMSVDFSPSYSRIVLPLFFGFLLVILLRNGLFQQK